jgi:predicted nucleic acid-binding protein
MKVRLETIAKLHIQTEICSGAYELVWSYVLDLENNNNPYEEKRNAIRAWKNIASYICTSSEEIWSTSKIIEQLSITPKDALHIACALKSSCDYFITTDAKLLNKKITGIHIISPIDFIIKKENL